MGTKEVQDVGSKHAERGVYAISVAAEMAGTGMQNLRLYERRGLLRPSRSAGGTRLYSVNDVVRLNRITVLLADGLNLAGIALVLDLQDDNARMHNQMARTHRADGDKHNPSTPV